MIDALLSPRAGVTFLGILAALAPPAFARAQSVLAVDTAASAVSDAAPAQGATPAPEQASPTPTAPESAATDPEAEPEEEWRPLQLSGSIETSLGQGTFVSNAYARNPYVGWSLDLSPSYKLDRETTVGASIGLSQELTNSDGDTYNRQLFLSDAGLRISRKFGTIPVVDIGVNGSLSLSFPTSLASQYQTLLVGTSAKVGLSRDFGPVSVGLSTTFRKNFHQYTSPTLDLSDYDEQIFLAREGGAENLGEALVSPGGINTSWSLRNALSVSYAPIEALSFGLSYSLGHSFRYRGFPKDELSSPYADAGVGRSDSFSAGISADYTINDMFSVSAGINTGAAPKSDDNKTFRFPFWDFESTAENLTTFSLNLTVTESFATGE